MAARVLLGVTEVLAEAREEAEPVREEEAVPDTVTVAEACMPYVSVDRGDMLGMGLAVPEIVARDVVSEDSDPTGEAVAAADCVEAADTWLLCESGPEAVAVGVAAALKVPA